jgi:uncharacterized protein
MKNIRLFSCPGERVPVRKYEQRQDRDEDASMQWKPSENEEESFARKEFERKRQLEEKKLQALKEGEKKKLQELHFMKCPKCGSGLIEIDYGSIKVDKCSGCEGVWLDSGELEAVSRLDKPVLERGFSGFRK